MTDNSPSSSAPAGQRFAKVKVAIIIKALNEERYIARCLDSALRATEHLDAVIVLADSGSVDRTLEIARDRAVRVVQLTHYNERSCGIGAQLGYQFVDADYVYILDGDMELEKGFLEQAIAILDAEPRLAGLGGLVEERGGGNYEFERRKALQDGMVTGDVSALDMGGLYRASAVAEVGYLTNRNLHSYEEKELSFRLLARGYGLRRIAVPAVVHHGKQDGTASLLFKRLKSRHLDGSGEMTRSFLGSRLFYRCLSQFKPVIVVALSWVALLVSLVALPFTPWLLVAVMAFNILLFMNFLRRTRQVSTAGVAYANINILAYCYVRGLFRSQRNPAAWIDARVVQ